MTEDKVTCVHERRLGQNGIVQPLLTGEFLYFHLRIKNVPLYRLFWKVFVTFNQHLKRLCKYVIFVFIRIIFGKTNILNCFPPD